LSGRKGETLQKSQASLVGLSFVIQTGYFPHMYVRNITIRASVLGRHLVLRGYKITGIGFNKETKTADRDFNSKHLEGGGGIMGTAKLAEAKLPLLSRFAPVCIYR